MFIIRPKIYNDETVFSYKWRLAFENGYTNINTIAAALRRGGVCFDTEIKNHIGEKISESYPIDFYRYLNRGTLRFCPICLQKDFYLRKAWDLSLIPICVIHNSLLLDCCSQCGELILKNKYQRKSCLCGKHLHQMNATKLSNSNLLYLIHRLISQKPTSSLPINDPYPKTISKLSRLELSKLVHCFGAYSRFRHTDKPLKVTINHNIKNCYKLVDGAHEVLSLWPKNIGLLFDQTNFKNTNSRQLSMNVGRIYRVLGSFLNEECFAPLVIDIYRWICSSWPEHIYSPNSNLLKVVSGSLSYLSGTDYCIQNKISRHRLEKLINSKQLAGDIRVLPSNHKQVTIKKSDAKIFNLSNLMTLSEAAKYMGFPKVRLREVLYGGYVYGIAPNIGERWEIPKSELNLFICMLMAKTCKKGFNKRVYSLNNILRHRVYDSFSFVDFLAYLLGNKNCFMLQSSNVIDLQNNLLISSDSWDDYRSNNQLLTVEQVAIALNVKYEVVSSLIKLALIPYSQKSRNSRLIDQMELEKFTKHYIFLRDLAIKQNTSSRKVLKVLQKLEVDPICGPKYGNCRQYLFKRKLLTELTPTLLETVF